MDSYERTICYGREFLTWLWAQTELLGGEFEVDDQRLALYVDEELVLVDELEDGGTDILRMGDPSVSQEAKAALLSGKKARQLRFGMVLDSAEYLFSLDERLQIRGLRMPPSEAEHPADILADQLDGLEAVSQLLDQLFMRFTAIRLSEEWKAELKRMRTWVSEK